MNSKSYNIISILLNSILIVIWIFVAYFMKAANLANHVLLFPLSVSILPIVIVIMSINYNTKKPTMVITNNSKLLMIISIILCISHGLLLLWGILAEMDAPLEHRIYR